MGGCFLIFLEQRGKAQRGDRGGERRGGGGEVMNRSFVMHMNIPYFCMKQWNFEVSLFIF